MHRRTKGMYEQKIVFEKLYEAWKVVSQTCKNRRGVLEFSLFANARLSLILKELRERKYWPNKYRCFMIFEPKPRLVMSQSIRDKIVNHFVAREYLLPLLERTLIDTNVATRKEMGALFAQKMLRRYFSQITNEHPSKPIYVLKIDISKYFYTIDHGVLFKKLRKKIKDPDVLEILCRIVGETNKPYINKVIDGFNSFYHTSIPHYEKGRGLSIGAMTSQFLAIFYLNDVDHYIKEVLKCRYYIRYMDDFLIFGYDKKYLQKIRGEIEKQLEGLNLRVNPKSTIYNCSGNGFTFLGYRYFVDERQRLRIVCMAHTVRRVRKRLRLLTRHNPEKAGRSYEAYRGYFLNTVPRRGIEEVIGRDPI